MSHQASLQEKRSEVLEHLKELKNCQTYVAKDCYLSSLACVKAYLKNPGYVRTFLAGLNPECSYVIKCLILIHQAAFVFELSFEQVDKFQKLREILNQLLEVEKLYQHLGGILAYYTLFLDCCLETQSTQEINYLSPEKVDLSNWDVCTEKLVGKALEHLSRLAVLFPVGGAGERLGLQDSQGKALPVGFLKFKKKTLLEALFNDVMAWEHLYQKRFGKTCSIPIGLMTSEVNNNHDLIEAFLKKHDFFGKKPEDVYLFSQPLVPVLSQNGDFLMQAQLELLRRPGGHGAIWNTLMSTGVLDQFLKRGKDKALVRQINNPAAAQDFPLLSFLGLGFEKEALFGFASCPRLVGSSEGMNVCLESHNQHWLSNIEYTEFEKKQIKDEPVCPGSSFSVFPSNTNLLFVDLPMVKEKLQKKSVFSPVVNFKSAYHCFRSGSYQELFGGRVESMMQNLCDELAVDKTQALTSYLSFANRTKTISVCKKAYVPNKSFLETPLGCVYELLQNDYELLENHSGFSLPAFPSSDFFEENGAPFYLFYRHTLGPIYADFAKKIKKGTLAYRAYLDLDIDEVEIQNLYLDGAFKIWGRGKESSCHVKNCRVENLGLKKSVILPQQVWELDLETKESFNICLGKNSRFIADGITFSGHFDIKVPDNTCMIVQENSSHELFFVQKAL